MASDCTSETTNAALSSLSSQRSTLDALSTNTTSLATALTAFGNSMNSIKTRLAQVVADAAATGLPDASADLVVGEAMLTIQSDEHKREIIAEAVRLLAPGGRYAVHELALRGDRSPEELDAVRRTISRTIKVGAQPLPLGDWRRLLTEAGLEVEWTGTAPMHLLEPRRLIEDEGPLGAARFWCAVRRTPGARDRVRAMRQGFRLQGELLTAVGVVARKPSA